MNAPHATAGESGRRAIDPHLDRFIRRSTWVFRGMVLALFVNATFTVSLLNANGDRVDDNSRVLAALQAERVRNIRTGCVELNDRNVDTKREVSAQIPDRRRAQVTLALVDRLVPIRDCEQLVAKQAPSATQSTP